MRATVMREGKLVVDTLPDPEPGPGEVLVKTLACGICGSDLHALRHGPEMVAVARETGIPFEMDLSRDVVMGHEFCAEILDFGPECRRTLRPGTRVCALPVLPRGGRLEGVGYSNEAPGGFAEYMLLSEALLLEVPDALPSDQAALTEPMAVGVHAVNKARLEGGEAALVIGCGPVGLSVIAALRLAGTAPILAADFSPTRRRLAEALGADAGVDPAERSPYEAWAELSARAGDATAGAPLLALGSPRPAVIFECVGLPGVLDAIMRGAPRGSRIVVVGLCMEPDSIRPMYGVNKELGLQFVFAYSPEEFAGTLRSISEGRIALEPLITGKVGVEGVARAFEELAHPERHAKILVEPWRG